MVVFSTNDFTYHGHSQPLTAPPGRLRRSLASYYYSAADYPSNQCLRNNCDLRHSTLWKFSHGVCAACEHGRSTVFRSEEQQDKAGSSESCRGALTDVERANKPKASSESATGLMALKAKVVALESMAREISLEVRALE